MESETGLSRDVVRKWEDRYGFPQPERDEHGNRIYPPDQVASLRLIRQLLGSGHRPGKIVGLDHATLLQMVEKLAPPPSTSFSKDNFSRKAYDALSRHDLMQLSTLLRGELYRQGLSQFVRKTLSTLVVGVGESWRQGEIRVFEEHLFTQAVCDILHDAIRTVTDYSGTPRILLSTPPKELHTLGLLMANAELSLHGACCVGLGAQPPEAEIVEAVKACSIDIVGLAFSMVHPVRESTRFLHSLRQQLDPTIDIWAGGQGSTRFRQIAGVTYIHDLDRLGTAVDAWIARKPLKKSPV